MSGRYWMFEVDGDVMLFSKRYDAVEFLLYNGIFLKEQWIPDGFIKLVEVAVEEVIG